MKEGISLTPEEVAGILKIKKNTVYEMIKRGELPAYRIGRKIRIEPRDLETYKKLGKKMGLFQSGVFPVASAAPPLTANESTREEPLPPAISIVICGQDLILDILTRSLDEHNYKVRAYRSHVGSFSGLMSLYHGKAQLAAIHLWDGDTGNYNVPYVRRMLPGISTVIVHLALRMQGFYVARGNPKNIKEWQDLTRSDVHFVNREKGCGTRVLLDEKLRLLGINRRSINGYDREENNHHSVASTVARGEADVGLGNEKTSLQVRGLDFIPLHKERYELVMKQEDLEKPAFRAVMDILRSSDFRKELQGLGDYDLTETGKVVAEL